MRKVFSTTVRGAIALCAALAGAMAGAQPDKPMLALTLLEPGLWQIRVLDRPNAPRQMCIADPTNLIQLEHPRTTCSRVVLRNEPELLSIHYVCPMGGYGQTSLRVETSRLVQLDTQGIARRAPFAYRAELRRVGTCDQQKALR